MLPTGINARPAVAKKGATLPTNPKRAVMMANGGKVGVGKGPVKSSGTMPHPATSSNVLGGGRDSYRK